MQLNATLGPHGAGDARVVFTDTSTLWTVDSLIRQYGDWRAPECLARLLDVLLDPRTELRCFFQAPGLGEDAQKVPLTYSALRRAELLRPETEITAKDHEAQLSVGAMGSLSELMFRWARANPRYATAFRDLHRHPEVFDPARYKALSEDGREDAVPPITYEFCHFSGQADMLRIGDALGWSLDDVVFVYAILLRGTQYEYATHQMYLGQATYLTHPARWLGSSAGFAISPGSPGVVTNRLGGRIARAWIESKHKDFGVLLDWVLQARANLHPHTAFLDGRVTDPKEMAGIAHDALSPIPPKLKDGVTASFFGGATGAVAGSLLAGVPGALVGWIAGSIVTRFFNSEWSRALLPERVPKELARIPLVRDAVDYPDLAATRYACPRCGTENLAPRCPVCDYAKAASPVEPN
jgi:hypothetical protein